MVGATQCQMNHHTHDPPGAKGKENAITRGNGKKTGLHDGLGKPDSESAKDKHNKGKDKDKYKEVVREVSDDT